MNSIEILYMVSSDNNHVVLHDSESDVIEQIENIDA